MSNSKTVARPYAKAAFEYASEHQTVKSWQKMLSLVASLISHQEIKTILTSNNHADLVTNLFFTICGDHLDNAGKNFIRLMATNKRLLLLPDVLELFEQYVVEQDSIVEIEAITATKLTKDQKQKIVAGIQKQFSRKIKLIAKMEKSMLSGLIIRVNGMVIDNSIKRRLERLTDVLQS